MAGTSYADKYYVLTKTPSTLEQKYNAKETEAWKELPAQEKMVRRIEVQKDPAWDRRQTLQVTHVDVEWRYCL